MLPFEKYPLVKSSFCKDTQTGIETMKNNEALRLSGLEVYSFAETTVSG